MQLYLDDNNRSQFNMNCTHFTMEDFKHLNLLRSITAFVCSTISLVILIYLICSKAFSSLLKRLFFYLIVATLFSDTVVALNIEHQWQYTGQDKVCELIGLFSQFSYVVIIILSYEIIVHLLCLVVSQIRGSQPFPQYTRSRYCAIFLEIAYIVFPLLMSVALSVPPYFKRVYGIAGPWCWVPSFHESDGCNLTGRVTQITFFTWSLILAIVEITPCLVFLVIYYKIISFQNARLLFKQTFYVTLFLIVHMLMKIYEFTVSLYTFLTHYYQSYDLWAAYAVIGPVGALAFPLGYWLFFYPVKSKVLKVIHMTIKCCKCKSFKSDWQAETLNVTNVATAPTSDRITQPSHTYFAVRHPDIFTETSPVNVSDTGYHSIIN